MGRKLRWLQWRTSHLPGAGRAHNAHQVPTRETKPEDTAGATGSPARMLGSRLDALECQAGPEGSGGAQVTIRSVQAPHGVETEEPGGLLDQLVPHGCPGDVTLGIGSRLQQQDLAFRCLQTTGQGSEWVSLGATGLGGPLTCFGCSVPQSVRLFVTPWTAALQASLPTDNSWSSLKLTSIESVMPSNHLILCRPLLLLPSIFPSIGVLSNESVLRVRWPKDWSFSISPSVNVQDRLPSGLAALGPVFIGAEEGVLGSVGLGVTCVPRLFRPRCPGSLD